jgi:hypothetical protein
VPFLPPHAKPSSLLWGDAVLYTTTSDGCGAAPNAVWAIDLTSKDQKPVTTWATGGPNVAGTGPAFATDGTLYVALGRGAGTYSSAVVALDRYTLQPKDWFFAPDADFNTSPIVFHYKDKDLLAVTGNDGRLYLLDATSLGGGDHKTPLHVTAKFTAPGAGAALATWEDQAGSRWILAPVVGAPQSGSHFTANGLAPTGSVVAFKLADEGAAPTLQPAWRSRDLTSPLGPIVVNGMVFAVSSGEYRPTGSAPGTATPNAPITRCCISSTARPARRCGPAARRSPRSHAAACPPAPDRSTWSRSTITCMPSAFRWSIEAWVRGPSRASSRSQ